MVIDIPKHEYTDNQPKVAERFVYYMDVGSSSVTKSWEI